VRFAIFCANFGYLADPALLLDIAERAEAAGWDGFFLYDHIVVGRATVDPWTVLSAVAARTTLMLGPMVVAVPRRQPWELAHQTIALDRLSEGRLILGVGLGEEADHAVLADRGPARARGERLDEALGLITRLWAGEKVTHKGHWQLDGLRLDPGPRAGQIPIWVGGRHPRHAPMRRAAHFQGAFPIDGAWDVRAPLRPDQLGEMVRTVHAERGSLEGFEVATAGVTRLGDPWAERTVAAYAAVGATWWLETLEPRRGDLRSLLETVDSGPPRLDVPPTAA
jgi:alkanesulfonate monooxygenase SsuD/methylene tetrahydromethanopterin reductase-like flavin-dependent oxidoreductase (luciferase family)